MPDLDVLTLPDHSVTELPIEPLLVHCGGDREFALRLIALFQQQVADDLQQLSGVLAAGLCPDVALIAHRIKSAARWMSLTSLEHAAAALETMGRDRDLSRAAGVLDMLSREIRRYCPTDAATAAGDHSQD